MTESRLGEGQTRGCGMTFVYFTGHLFKYLLIIGVFGLVVGAFFPTLGGVVTFLGIIFSPYAAWQQAKASAAKEMIEEKQREERIAWAERQKNRRNAGTAPPLSQSVNPLRAVGSAAAGAGVGYVLAKMLQEGNVDQAIAFAGQQDLEALADQLPESPPELDQLSELEADEMDCVLADQPPEPPPELDQSSELEADEMDCVLADQPPEPPPELDQSPELEADETDFGDFEV